MCGPLTIITLGSCRDRQSQMQSVISVGATRYDRFLSFNRLISFHPRLTCPLAPPVSPCLLTLPHPVAQSFSISLTQAQSGDAHPLDQGSAGLARSGIPLPSPPKKPSFIHHSFITHSSYLNIIRIHHHQQKQQQQQQQTHHLPRRLDSQT